MSLSLVWRLFAGGRAHDSTLMDAAFGLVSPPARVSSHDPIQPSPFEALGAAPETIEAVRAYVRAMRDAIRREPDGGPARNRARISLRYLMLQSLPQLDAVRDYVMRMSAVNAFSVRTLTSVVTNANVSAMTPRGSELAGMGPVAQRAVASPAHVVECAVICVSPGLRSRTGVEAAGQRTGTILDAPMEAFACFRSALSVDIERAARAAAERAAADPLRHEDTRDVRVSEVVGEEDAGRAAGE